MSPDKAKKIILVSILGIIILVVAGDAAEGKAPKPARFLAVGFVILILVGGAEVAPGLAAAFAMVAFVGVALERLGPIASRFANVVGGRVPLGTLSPSTTDGGHTAVDTSTVATSTTERPAPGKVSHVRYPFDSHYKLIGFPYQGTHLLFGNWESDNAVDIAAPCGTPVLAVDSGTIGNQFGLLSTSGLTQGIRLHLVTRDNEWYYAHLQKVAFGIHPGAKVSQGTVLGYSGKAGPCHLHIGAKNGNPQTLLGA